MPRPRFQQDRQGSHPARYRSALPHSPVLATAPLKELAGLGGTTELPEIEISPPRVDIRVVSGRLEVASLVALCSPSGRAKGLRELPFCPPVGPRARPLGGRRTGRRWPATRR